MKLYRSPAAARGAVCGALILFVFAPIVFILVRSLENPARTVITDLPGLIDNYISFAQYETVLFHHRAFWTAWWNTLILAVPVLLLSAAVAALAAYGTATLKPRPQRLVYGAYMCCFPCCRCRCCWCQITSSCMGWVSSARGFRWC